VLWPSLNANGVEDCLSGAAVAARTLQSVAEFSARLTAIELIIAARAIALRELRDGIAAPLRRAIASVRQIAGSEPPGAPAGEAIERLARHCLTTPLR
jgi:histidine ammonia-lyase